MVYTTINGVVVHEQRAGVGRNYRPDTLGNTVALHSDGLAMIWVGARQAAGNEIHATIVLSDGNPGTKTIIFEGGPNWDVKGTGRLLGDLTGGSHREDNNLAGTSDLRINDKDTVEYWKQRLTKAIPSKVVYFLVPWENCGGGNSNSWVREVLENDDIDSSYPKGSLDFPGWEADPWDKNWHDRLK